MAIKPTAMKKKLIEVALPLGRALTDEERKKLGAGAARVGGINDASAREKSIRHGHPSTLHLWWARRPLAAARAVIFAQMVDDPSSLPDLFPTEKKQNKERERLFRIIEDLVQWENTTNETVLEAARAEIWQSWRRACAENADHPRAKDLFNRTVLPGFHDPFAGGGALPLEAQRLGLESHASDLNPVAVLINKAMIEIPPKFAGRSPVNPAARKEKALIARQWKGAQGLAEDVRYYGQWMRDEAEKRIGKLYPKVAVTAEMAKGRPDLKPYVGQQLTVIAWLWARTVKSPNPAFASVDVPLASTFMLSTKAGKEAYVEPVIEGGGYRFTVKVGKPRDAEKAKGGTKLSRGANFACLMSGTPMAGDYIKGEGKAGRMGARLMAIVAEGTRGRVYLAPTPEHEAAARKATPEWKPEVTISGSTQYLGVKPYGMDRFDQLFTDRQLVALTTFSDLVGEAMQQVRRDALQAGLPDDPKPLRDGGTGATAYAEAVGVYLGFVVDKCADYWSGICSWHSSGEKMRNTFGRQAIPMVWDYAEANPLCESSGNWMAMVDWTWKSAAHSPAQPRGCVSQADAHTQSVSADKLVATDPPYYDNVPYADLSDFFYVWLRRSLRGVFPDLFATLAVPKAEELVAFAYRHEGGKSGAEAFFLDGMTQAMHRLVEQAHPAFPVTIYYAFKQAESDNDAGTSSTGWETFLDSVVRAGFAISGTWPMRTELANRMRGMDANALASSIVLVCRQREATAPTATRREFVAALKSELPVALRHLQEGNIAPVDLAQAAIGPGMAVYTRYSKVLDAEGKPVAVREALALINQVLDETLAEQEGDFDADSRFAIAWFEQHGFAEGEFGVADVLARAKVTSVKGLEEAGILESKRGKVRLFKASELPADWDPASDARLTHWEIVHHLIRTLESGGESAAAALMARVGAKAEIARELAYRLYGVCERKKRAAEALQYNALVQSFPEITRLAREGGKPKSEQQGLFGKGDE
jgi:putative DNA methylase